MRWTQARSFRIGGATKLVAVPGLPTPSLADEVVRLRPWAIDDAPALVAAWADPEVGRHAAVPEPADVERARRWIARAADRAAAGLALDLVVAEVSEPSVVVGEVGLGPIDWTRATAELGFWVGAPHRGQGLATRAVALLADWSAGELPLRHLIARIAPDHAASAAVIGGAGFTLRGRLADGRDLWARSSESGGARGTVRT